MDDRHAGLLQDGEPFGAWAAAEDDLGALHEGQVVFGLAFVVGGIHFRVFEAERLQKANPQGAAAAGDGDRGVGGGVGAEIDLHQRHRPAGGHAGGLFGEACAFVALGC